MRFFSRFFGSRRQPDPERFLRELAAAHPGKMYRPMDKYRDFRAVFLGSEQGMRVLYEIFAWGNMFRPSAPKANFETNRTFFHDGERNICLRIMTVMHAEPRNRQEDGNENQRPS